MRSSRTSSSASKSVTRLAPPRQQSTVRSSRTSSSASKIVTLLAPPRQQSTVRSSRTSSSASKSVPPPGPSGAAKRLRQQPQNARFFPSQEKCRQDAAQQQHPPRPPTSTALTRERLHPQQQERQQGKWQRKR
ncbi:unnamed protein product [Ectocarpus fasciculatus]